MSPTHPPSDAAADRSSAHTQSSTARVILAVGTDDWAIEQSAASLEVAGHTVMRCHEPGEEAFPCNAFRGSHGCPLDRGVDAVVTSRARPMAAPASGETGVTCGLRAGLPLIVNGISRNSPFNDLAVSVVGEQGDLVDAVDVATAKPTLVDLNPAKQWSKS